MLLPRILGLASLLVSTSYAARIPASPTPQSSTLVDALSADPDFALLLRLVQRAKLVPTLNKLNGSTFFAPTNDAIERYRKKAKHPAWDLAFDDSLEDLTDNVQWALRQHLFYHLLNYTVKEIPEEVTSQFTLHFPEVPTEPPSKDPPPSPPWLPVPGGLLGGKPQRLRTAARDGKTFIGVDFNGQGGAGTAKDVIITANGNVYGVDGVLELPQDLLHEVTRHPGLSTIARLLPDALRDTLSSSPHLTLFFPLDSAWENLDPVEMQYLESGFAEKDMAKIVGLHSSGTGSDGHGMVGWTETWNKTTNFTTIEGHTVKVEVLDDGSATVSGRKIEERDILAANGVLHTVGSLLLSPDIFQLNAEKYLLALNATSFVSLLRATNLSHYVDDYHDGKPWTILAPRDDVFSSPTLWSPRSPGEDGGSPIPGVNMTELARILKYHFIPGKLSPQDFEDGSFLGTELHEPGLSGNRQLVQVSVHGSGTGGAVVKNGNSEIGFGGALVIGDAVEIGDSIIYVLSKPLTPPVDVIETSLPSAHFSTFLTSVFATHLDDILRTEPSTTVLIPHNSVWSELGLLTDYLLLPESRDYLKDVVRHHVLKGIVYPGDGVLNPQEFKTFPTLEGSDVRIDNGHATASGGWISSPHLSPIEVNTEGMLTQTGFMHPIRGGLLIPRSVQVNVGNLAEAGKASVMIGLVQKAGYGGVLNGTLRLDLDEWEKDPVQFGKRKEEKDPKSLKHDTEEVGWTLLCPRDDAFKGINITKMLEDTDGLKAFVRQHIIPVPANPAVKLTGEPDPQDEMRPLPVSDEVTYSSLHSATALHGDLVFRLTGSNVNSYVVGIKGAKGSAGAADFARVLKWGRTTITASSARSIDMGPLPVSKGQTGFQMPPSMDVAMAKRPTAMRSGVILIDRPIIPYEDGWWVLWGQAIVLGIVGSFFIVGGWTSIIYWWRGKEAEATYEPIGGHDDD